MGRDPELKPRFLPAGDAALVVEFGDRVDRELSGRVLRLSSAVRQSNITGVVETVPTFRSLMVLYDPVVTDSASLSAAIEQLHDRGGEHEQARKTFWLPACYESQYAPDLAYVAERTGRSCDEIIQVHASLRFHVYMIGFAPGHPYLGDLPDWLALPRRADPRVNVPAGSIAIAGNMSVIYPMESPGGWHLIGATPVRLFDLHSPEPSLLKPGDTVCFESISAAQFVEIRGAVEAGTYKVRCKQRESDAGY